MAGPSPDPNAPILPVDLRTLWRLLMEKKWVIAALVALCVAAGFTVASRLPRIYVATSTLQVEHEEQKLVKVDRRSPDSASYDEILKTIEQNLVSPALALRLAHHSELANDPAFLPDVERPATDARLRAAVSSKISASVRRGTRLIDVNVEDENPEMAQKIARLLVDEFLRGSVESRVQVSQVAHVFLREEAERLKARLARSENALQQYKEQHRAVSLEEKQNIVVERLKELSAKVTEAKTERLKLETDRAQLERMAGDTPANLLILPSIAGAAEVGELRTKISEKETEIAALSRRYKAEHPKYIQAASELSELQSGLDGAIVKAAALIGSAYEAAQTTESKLEQALRGQEELALELSKMAIPYVALERDVASDRSLYDALLARLKEAEVAQGVSQYAIHVVSPALVPEKPAKPNKRLIILISLCGGLALGCTFAMGAHLLDATLKTVDHAEQALGMHSLAAIPARGKTTLENARRLLMEKPQSAVAESFRALRTSLLFAGQGRGYSTILFTSAIPGEGKSFCAMNYAVALAQQGFRTLLIDADLRLPSIGRAFLGDERTTGLAEALLGECEFGSAVRLTSIENLSVLAAGRTVSNPSELIGKSNIAGWLQQLKERFDRIVIDTAPVHAVSETLLLAPHAEAVCFVVRARKTPAAAALRAVRKICGCGASLAGFVLNGVPLGNGGYYYHYHAPGYGGDEVYGGSTAAKG